MYEMTLWSKDKIFYSETSRKWFERHSGRLFVAVVVLINLAQWFIYFVLFVACSLQTENLIPLNFVPDNSKSDKANLLKFSGLILETVLELLRQFF